MTQDMKKLIAGALALMISATGIHASLPRGWEGTMTPIDTEGYAEGFSVPDSLKTLFINHVGRHGSRYLSSRGKVTAVTDVTEKHPCASRQRKTLDSVIAAIETATAGRWGELSPLGMEEERIMAKKLQKLFPEALASGKVKARSTYVPRCVMTMYSFTHTLTLGSEKVSVSTSEGKRYSPLLFFFATDKEYDDFREHGAWIPVYDAYVERNVPVEPALRVAPGLPPAQARKLTLDIYSLVHGATASGVEFDPLTLFSESELKACELAGNLRHALRNTATDISGVADRAAMPLLTELITTADAALYAGGTVRANLRFAHAETLMPLLALMDLPGCRVEGEAAKNGDKWEGWRITPLGANLVLTFYRAPSGTIRTGCLLNGKPVDLLGDGNLYPAWNDVRTFWLLLTAIK